LAGSAIADLLGWSEAEFLRRTEGSAIRRIGHARWLRNLALAAGNALATGGLSADEQLGLQQALAVHAEDPDPVVQEQVAWSLAKAAVPL
jgi:epoxyqueuosine reductase